MSRDFDNSMKKILDNNKELHKDNNKDLIDLKKTLKNIDDRLSGLEEKIDIMLDILNSLTLMVFEEEEDDEDNDQEDFDSNEGWLPENDQWNNYEDES